MRSRRYWAAGVLTATCLTTIALPAPQANAYPKHCREQVSQWYVDDHFIFHSVAPVPFKVGISVDTLYKYCHKTFKQAKVTPRKVSVCYAFLQRVIPPNGTTPFGLIGYDFTVTHYDSGGKSHTLPERFAKYQGDRQECRIIRIPKADRIKMRSVDNPRWRVLVGERVRIGPNHERYMTSGGARSKLFAPPTDYAGPWGVGP